MSLLKNIVNAFKGASAGELIATAVIAKHLVPPKITPPSGFTIKSTRPTIGGKWKISYYKDTSPNIGKSMTIGRSIVRRSEGGDYWKFDWS